MTPASPPDTGPDDATWIGIGAGAILLASVVLLMAITEPWLLWFFAPYPIGFAAIALYYGVRYGLPALWAWMWR